MPVPIYYGLFSQVVQKLFGIITPEHRRVVTGVKTKRPCDSLRVEYIQAVSVIVSQ